MKTNEIEIKARQIICGEHHTTCEGCSFNNGACSNEWEVDNAVQLAKWVQSRMIEQYEELHRTENHPIFKCPSCGMTFELEGKVQSMWSNKGQGGCYVDCPCCNDRHWNSDITKNII